MNMHEKWSKLLKQYYTALNNNCFIEAITPELLHEYEQFKKKNSLFGISVMDVQRITIRLLSSLEKEYEQNSQQIPFEQFIEQELISEKMFATSKFIKSCIIK